KANQNPNNSFLQFIFKENDQLCIKHYNEFVIYDRNNRKSKRKKKNQDSLYHNTIPRKKICVELNEYEELLNISKEINILKKQISILNTEKDESISWGASVIGINTLANMGICSTYQTVYNESEKLTKNHQSNIQEYIQANLKNLVIGCIDDYHNLHGTRIPNVTSISQIAHMATILFNSFDSTILKMALFQDHIQELSKGYYTIKQNWIQNLFNENILELLIIHSYDADLYGKYGRIFNRIKLVECIKTNLKNTQDYLKAIETFIKLPSMQHYLQNYVVPIPADFPGQLFI
ncbi:32234_t:CDS:2, partial [Racocetra persica]